MDMEKTATDRPIGNYASIILRRNNGIPPSSVLSRRGHFVLKFTTFPSLKKVIFVVSIGLVLFLLDSTL